MKRAGQGAFTLIELMIVVAIVAVLAAIAIPNFLEAQTRAKVSAARGNLRNVAFALETYAVDHGTYPPSVPRTGTDGLGLLADKQLAGLTSPVAYISQSAFRDPFGTVQAQTFSPRRGGLARRDNDFPTLSPPNTQKALLYYNYPSMAVRFQEPALYMQGAAVVSLGPDAVDSLGAWLPIPPELFAEYFGYTGIQESVSTIYDATNGTVSSGDISRFAGEARRVEQQ